jgi:hypothetical protein
VITGAGPEKSITDVSGRSVTYVPDRSVTLPRRTRGRQPPGVQSVTGVAMLRARPGDLTLRLARDESRNMERCYGPVERRRRSFGHDEGHVEQAFVGAIG